MLVNGNFLPGIPQGDNQNLTSYPLNYTFFASCFSRDLSIFLEQSSLSDGTAQSQTFKWLNLWARKHVVLLAELKPYRYFNFKGILLLKHNYKVQILLIKSNSIIVLMMHITLIHLHLKQKVGKLYTCIVCTTFFFILIQYLLKNISPWLFITNTISINS